MASPANGDKPPRLTQAQIRAIVSVIAVIVAVVMVFAGYKLDEAQRPAGPPRSTSSLTVSPASSDLPHHYANCAEAWADGRTNIPRGDIDYHPALDRDGDGVACQRGD